MTVKPRKLFNIVKIVIIVYCGIGIALYYLQEKFLFHPVTLPASYIYDFDIPFKEYSIAVNAEDTISLLSFFTRETKKGAVVYFHGNRKNVEHYYSQVQQFTDRGYDVWMCDYSGFGKSTGLRTEEKMYSQALQVYKMAAAQNGADSIVLFGKSLGTGIAAYVAANMPAKELILETPYKSITALFDHYAPVYPVRSMSNYTIPLFEYLQQVKSKVVIIHGDDDEVIPYSQAIQLRQYLKPQDVFITVKNGKHNNLSASAEFKEMLDRELK